MRGKLTFLALLVSALLYTPGAVAIQPYAPLTVDAVSIITPDAALAIVHWTPGTEAADSYKVYGIDGDSMTYLGTTVNYQMPVTANYSSFAVSGVKNGIESDKVYAALVPCIYVDANPPNVHVGNCGLVAPVMV